MQTLTMIRAARRWSGYLPGGGRPSGASEEDLWAAIFAGGQAGELTGLILGPPPAGQAGPGAVTSGQQVSGLDNGHVTVQRGGRAA